MGNNVTTTPVEALNIDQNDDDFDDNNDIKTNVTKNNDFSSEERNTSDTNQRNDISGRYQNDQEYNEHWNHYNQRFVGYPSEQPLNDYNPQHDEPEPQSTAILEPFDETTDVLNDMNDSKSLNDSKPMFTRPPNIEKSHSLPILVRSIDGMGDNMHDIDDLESIESGSKLTLNDVRSDTEDVIQELVKLSIDLDEKDNKYPINYRKRGQSWSNWDNNVHNELMAESSLSSFSRPASINDNTVSTSHKTKSYTAPEARGHMDSAIEWLAKQHGLEVGSALEFERHKSSDFTNSRNTLRLSSMEIPGSVSIPSTPAKTENEMNLKYDDFDQQIIHSIENDFIR